MDIDRIEKLKSVYQLTEHPEGGWFSEVYTSNNGDGLRASAGSIYFMLCGDELSHFHQIDCDEIWYHHEGCSVKITSVIDGEIKQDVLGRNVESGERAMVIIPKGAIFAAENLDGNGYSFMSCVTAPKFTYDGFRLVGKGEICSLCGNMAEDILYLAFNDVEQIR